MSNFILKLGAGVRLFLTFVISDVNLVVSRRCWFHSFTRTQHRQIKASIEFSSFETSTQNQTRTRTILMLLTNKKTQQRAVNFTTIEKFCFVAKLLFHFFNYYFVLFYMYRVSQFF